MKLSRAAEKVQSALDDAGIEARIYYPEPLHVQPCFASLGVRGGDMPVSEDAAKTVLSLPIYPELSESTVTRICESIGAFFRSS